MNEESVLMCALRLLIFALLISACTAQGVPGNIRKNHKFYFFCVETEPPAPPPKWMKTFFPRPVLSQHLPRTAFSQDGSILTRIIPPPEFRMTPDLTKADTSGASLLLPRKLLCHGTRSGGSFH